jgi:hypothetical protein
VGCSELRSVVSELEVEGCRSTIRDVNIGVVVFSCLFLDSVAWDSFFGIAGYLYRGQAVQLRL